MLAHQTVLNHDYFLKLIISLQVWFADCDIGKQQERMAMECRGHTWFAEDQSLCIFKKKLK